MEFLFHDPSTHTYKLYHSLSRLCKDNGMDHKMISKDMLPVKTPKGLIIGLVPNTKI
jgi:hypothetical protein